MEPCQMKRHGMCTSTAVEARVREKNIIGTNPGSFNAVVLVC